MRHLSRRPAVDFHIADAALTAVKCDDSLAKIGTYLPTPLAGR